MSLKFIDIGANLTDLQFKGIYHGKPRHEPDLDGVLERAQLRNVDKILVTGSSLKESLEAVEMCKSHSGFLYCTAGVHPCSAKEVPKDRTKRVEYYTKLVDLILNNKEIKSYGEFGLDYDRFHYADKDTQHQVFKDQLVLASVLKLPLFLHMRNAPDFPTFFQNVESNDVIDEVLAKFNLKFDANSNSKPEFKGVVHSFTGTKEDLDEMLGLGFSIGINGCSLKTSLNLDVAKQVPLDKLMLETDGPWCEIRPTHASFELSKCLNGTNGADLPKKANKPEKKKEGELVKGRCEPCEITLVANVMSNLLEMDVEELAQQVYQNTTQLFNM